MGCDDDVAAKEAVRFWNPHAGPTRVQFISAIIAFDAKVS
jgi:hypothetical protein